MSALPPHLEDAVVPSHLRHIICFRIVKSGMTSWHGAKALGFSHTDIVAAPHKILSVQPESHEIVVDSSSMSPGRQVGTEMAVVSLSLLAPRTLLRVIHLEQRSMDIKYSLKVRLPAEHDWSDDELRGVLQRLCNEQQHGRARFDVESLDFTKEQPVLLDLMASGLVFDNSEDLGLAEGRYQYFSLTEAGRLAIAAGMVLHRGKALAEPRPDISLEDMNVWELVITLSREGWTHRIARRREVPEAFVPEQGGPKVWFSKRSVQNLSRSYLLLLAQKQKRVLHLQPAGYYNALVANKEWAPRGAVPGVGRSLPEDTLDVEEALRVASRPRGVAPQPHPPVGLPQASEPAEEPAPEVSVQPSSENPPVHPEQGSCDEGALSESEAATPPPASDPSSASSSDSDESSHSSSASSSSSTSVASQSSSSNVVQDAIVPEEMGA